MILHATKNADSTSITTGTSGTKTTIISEFTINNLVGYQFDCNIQPNRTGTTSNYINYFNFYNGTNQLIEKQTSSGFKGQYSTGYIEGPKSNVNFILKSNFYFNGYSNYSTSIQNGVLTYYYFVSITINKQIFTHKALPRELKELGNKAKTTLFGYHIDNTWFEGA